MVPLLATVFIAFPIALGSFIWWFDSHGNVHQLPGYLLTCYVYFYTFGIIFGMTMRNAGPRVFLLRPPWNWTAHLSLIIALSALCAAIVGLILGALNLVPPQYYWTHFGNEFLFDSGIALIIGLAMAQYMLLHKAIEQKELDLRNQQIEKERALKLASEAQLASLESRIHPHFLFNTLNSISALTQEDPVKAEQLIQRLSALLRFSLDSNSHGLALLGEEIKIVRDYLEIEQARFGKRLAWSIVIPPEAEMLRMPPLAVQTLVENSVKFAIAPRREGGLIRVQAKIQQEQLFIEVWDNGPGFSLAATPSGHGLDNLGGRLKSLFDGNAQLQAESKDGGTAVTVILPKICNGATGNS